MVSVSPMGVPRQLNTTGKAGVPKDIEANFSRRASPAGRIRRVWKGPLTFKGRQRFAPAALASSAARATAASSPPMTSWPGQL